MSAGGTMIAVFTASLDDGGVPAGAPRASLGCGSGRGSGPLGAWALACLLALTLKRWT